HGPLFVEQLSQPSVVIYPRFYVAVNKHFEQVVEPRRQIQRGRWSATAHAEMWQDNWLKLRQAQFRWNWLRAWGYRHSLRSEI
ncbi:hypothetical protein, partial [Burkholderia alba]|uniref:hypothetical protein n=1 Tax=Burkholderia alba TaxID=2683677 RepID=UPI002B055011